MKLKPFRKLTHKSWCFRKQKWARCQHWRGTASCRHPVNTPLSDSLDYLWKCQCEWQCRTTSSASSTGSCFYWRSWYWHSISRQLMVIQRCTNRSIVIVVCIGFASTQLKASTPVVDTLACTGTALDEVLNGWVC